MHHPVIQGTADVQGKVSAREVLDAVTFSTNAVRPSAGGQNVVLEESSRSLRSQVEQEMGDVANSLAKAYKDTDVYEGLMARLERGSLGLKAVGVMG